MTPPAPAVSWSFAYKYTAVFSNTITGNLMVLRLAEQYLPRAGARAQQGDIGGARSDVDLIPSRAGLRGTSGISREQRDSF